MTFFVFLPHREAILLEHFVSHINNIDSSSRIPCARSLADTKYIHTQHTSQVIVLPKRTESILNVCGS